MQAGNLEYSNHRPTVMVCTIPMRPVPTEYPPIGSLAILNALRKAGFDSLEFYDIDQLRPTYEEVLAHIAASRPNILGISAVVSTAYGYTKRLSLDVKRLAPDTTIILGGNLGASAEILLRNTGVDFVATSEGETVLVDFVTSYQRSRLKPSFSTVRGLLFLDGDRLINTGYPESIPKEEVYDIDWTMLEQHSRIRNFFLPATKSVLAESTFAHDPRRKEPVRRGKTIGSLVASKGCVARCTFCHRWDKGIRYIPVPIVMERLRYIIERYNVGFVLFGDENVGTDRTWLKEFCGSIKTFNVLWSVGGMRVSRMTPELLRVMRDAGCSAVYFGMESGSEKMLEIMEKRVKLEENYDTIKWIVSEGLDTTIQLVVGMPGETPETVNETVEFVNYAARLSRDRSPLKLSVNYAQALPGTPLYEVARREGIIGQGVEDEEQYLLKISDRNASDFETTLNFTGYPRLITECWRLLIVQNSAYAYISEYGRAAYRDHLRQSHWFTEFVRGDGIYGDPYDDTVDEDVVEGKTAGDTGYFNFPQEKVELGIYLIQVTPTCCGLARSGSCRGLAPPRRLAARGDRTACRASATCAG